MNYNLLSVREVADEIAKSTSVFTDHPDQITNQREQVEADLVRAIEDKALGGQKVGDVYLTTQVALGEYFGSLMVQHDKAKPGGNPKK